MCEYRAAKFDSALAMFETCDKVSSSPLLSTEVHPRFGARARALYSIGLVHREKYNLRAAIRYLTVSTELAYQSFLKNAESNSQNPSKLTSVAIARSLGMGLASVQNTLGRPDLALPLLMAAKAMLPPTEKIISTHIDLLRATLMPWRYPGSQEDPDAATHELDAVKQLQDCRAKFGDHRPYQTRTAYYLAKEYICRADELPQGKSAQLARDLFLSEAEKSARELEFLQSGDWRFELLGAGLLSEIARRRDKFEEAEKRATWALQQASSSHYPAVYLDLLMARGLARLGRSEYLRACDDFRAGLKLASDAGTIT